VCCLYLRCCWQPQGVCRSWQGWEPAPRHQDVQADCHHRCSMTAARGTSSSISAAGKQQQQQQRQRSRAVPGAADGALGAPHEQHAPSLRSGCSNRAQQRPPGTAAAAAATCCIQVTLSRTHCCHIIRINTHMTSRALTSKTSERLAGSAMLSFSPGFSRQLPAVPTANHAAMKLRASQHKQPPA